MEELEELRRKALGMEHDARRIYYGGAGPYTKLHVKEVEAMAALITVQIGYALLAFKEGR